MDDDYAKMRDQWIGVAYNILKEGKSHISIITFLRSKGLSDENAKKLSKDIFVQAKKRLLKEQIALRVLAWLLIITGAILPIILLIMGRVSIFAAFPVVIGIGILFKLPNPKPMF